MPGIELGTVRSRAVFDVTDFKVGVDQAISQLRRLQSASAGMGTAAAQGMGGVSEAYKRVQAQLSGVTQEATRAGNAVSQVATKTAKSIGDISMASLKQVYVLRQLASIADQWGQSMAMAGRRGLEAVGALVMSGADLNKTLVMIRNNTVLTNAEFAEMSNEVKRLGQETGADLGQIAMGVRHIRDYGFVGKQAMDMLTVATRAAVATGSDAGETAQLLGRIMKVFAREGFGASEAMNAVWFAAANSNLLMKEFVNGTERAIAMAGPFKIKFGEMAAMLSTFAKNGMSARLATTNFVNDLNKLTQPTGASGKFLTYLDTLAGPKLKQVFSPQWIQQNGIMKAFDLIQEKARVTGLNVTGVIQKLFPSLRGTAGALLLGTPEGLAEFRDALQMIARILGGELTPLTDRYAQTMRQLGPQIARVKNAFTIMAADISASLMPVLLPAVEWARSMVEWFSRLPAAVKQSTVAIIALGAGLSLLLGKILGIGTLLAQLAEARALIAALAQITGGAVGAGGIAGVLGLGGLAAATPWILGAAAALGVLVAGYYAVTKAQQDAQDAEKNAPQLRLAQAKATRASAAELKALAEQYNALRKEQEKKVTATGLEQLQSLIDRIGQAMPSLVTGWNSAGHALGFVDDWAKLLRDHLKEVQEQAHRTELSIKAVRIVEIAERRESVRAELESVQDLLRTHRELRRTAGVAVSTGPYAVMVPGTGPFRRVAAAPGSPGLSVAAAQARQYREEIKKLDEQWRVATGLVAAPKPKAAPGAAGGGAGVPDEAAVRAARDAALKLRGIRSDLLKLRVDAAKREGDVIKEAAARRKQADFDALTEWIRDTESGRIREKDILAAATKRRDDTYAANAAEEAKTIKDAAEKKRDAYARAYEQVYNAAMKDPTIQAQHDLNVLMENLRREGVSQDQRRVIYEMGTARIERDRQREAARTAGEEAKRETDQIKANVERRMEQYRTQQNLLEQLRDLSRSPLAKAVHDVWTQYFTEFWVDAETAINLKTARIAKIYSDFFGKIPKDISAGFAGMQVGRFLGRTPGTRGRTDLEIDLAELNRKRAFMNQEAFRTELTAYDKLYQDEYDLQLVAGENYIEYLNYRMEADKAFLANNYDEWLRFYQKRKQIEEDLNKPAAKPDEKKAETQDRIGVTMLKRLQTGTAEIFQSLFENILSGQKNFIQSFVDAFKQMLIRLAAEWAAAEVIKGLKGLFGGKQEAGAGGGAALAGAGASSSLFGTIVGGLGIGLGLAGLFKGLKFQEGGWVPGPIGAPRAAIVHGGEYVVPAGGAAGISINGPIHVYCVTDVGSLYRELGRVARQMAPVRMGS